MLNLLPKDYSNKVRQEYIRRFSIVLLIGISVVDIFLLVAIFPVYTSLNLRERIVEETKESIENSPRAKDKNIVLSNVKDLESRLKVVAVIPGDRPTDYIDKALELKSGGVYIRSISYTKKNDTSKEVVLEGVASSRASLVEFSKKIKSSSWSTSSDIPLSNFASDKNISFLFNLVASSTPR